jgi:hypothetical protein
MSAAARPLAGPLTGPLPGPLTGPPTGRLEGTAPDHSLTCRAATTGRNPR